MDSVEILIDNDKKNVEGIYYISDNNYYFMYTENNRDKNGYVILNIVKVLQEVINTPSGPSPTGNLVGITISDDNEWKSVQKDVSNIIADKQNHKTQAVRYLEMKLLKNIIIKSTRVFRLKEDIYKNTFKKDTTDKNDSLILDYKNKYYEESEKNKKLEDEIEKLNNKLNQIKNIIG